VSHRSVESYCGLCAVCRDKRRRRFRDVQSTNFEKYRGITSSSTVAKHWTNKHGR